METMVNKDDVTVLTNVLQNPWATACREKANEVNMGKIKTRNGRAVAWSRKWMGSQEQKNQGKNMQCALKCITGPREEDEEKCSGRSRRHSWISLRTLYPWQWLQMTQCNGETCPYMGFIQKSK